MCHALTRVPDRLKIKRNDRFRFADYKTNTVDLLSNKTNGFNFMFLRNYIKCNILSLNHLSFSRVSSFKNRIFYPELDQHKKWWNCNNMFCFWSSVRTLLPIQVSRIKKDKIVLIVMLTTSPSCENMLRLVDRCDIIWNIWFESKNESYWNIRESSNKYNDQNCKVRSNDPVSKFVEYDVIVFLEMSENRTIAQILHDVDDDEKLHIERGHFVSLHNKRKEMTEWDDPLYYDRWWIVSSTLKRSRLRFDEC